MNTPDSKVTVLVVDDSANNRRALTEMLSSSPDVEVLDRAGDGDEGLAKAATLRPDVITLDLEMPKLDGFSFLRLLMAQCPTPVIVISSYAHKSDVFKALELGAFDFIAKPFRQSARELQAMRVELLEKVLAVRLIRPHPSQRRSAAAKQGSSPFVVAVAASTGGPPAIQKLVEGLSAEPSFCLLVTQHMPARFTRAFAERLDRVGAFTVSEAKEGDALGPGRVYIAPGGRHLLLKGRPERWVLETPVPRGQDKHTPSADLLFQSVAEGLGAKAFGIVLTGMGSDGAVGAQRIRQAGGEVWAESEQSAVIYGMPKEAIAAGGVSRVLALPEMAPALVALALSRR